MEEIASRDRERQRWTARCEKAETRVLYLESCLRGPLACAVSQADGAAEELGVPPRLSAAETERMALLAGECGDIARQVGKVLRNGLNGESRAHGMSNRAALERALGGLRAVHERMQEAGDVRIPEVCAWRDRKRASMARWTRHQNGAQR